jgi:hypothetical protein
MAANVTQLLWLLHFGFGARVARTSEVPNRPRHYYDL